MSNSYPPGGYYFQLQFAGSPSQSDNAFQEASGLSVGLAVEQVQEGGQNTYRHRLPTAAKYANLVLKRGFVSSNSELATWCAATMTGDFSQPIQTRDVQVSLLDGSGTALAAWTFQDAYPVKWSLSDCKSPENALAIETMEFAYSNFQRL